MDDTTLNLDAYFQPPALEVWRDAASATLKGRPLTKLTQTSPEGLPIAPLYTREDALAVGLRPLPGDLASRREEGWDVRGLHDLGSPEQLSAAIQADLKRGVTSLWLVPRTSSRQGAALATREDLVTALQGVALDKTRLVLDAASGGEAWLPVLLEAAEQLGYTGEALSGEVHIDPLSTLATSGTLPHGVESAWKGLVEAFRFAEREAPGLKVACLSGLVCHRAGGHAAQELAWVLSAAVEMFRGAEAHGLAVEALAPSTVLQLAVGSHLFMDIAKLRAARLLWARVLSACGVDATAFIHACTSEVAYTRRDPWVNMLRGTAGCFAAAVGGADAITVVPFDRPLGIPAPLSARVATNTQVVLEAESHLAKVADPAGGSWYLEHLTDALAREAWSVFQGIEAGGGLVRALEDGSFGAACAATAAKDEVNVGRRKAVIVGVSEFANLDEPAVERQAPAAVQGSRSERLGRLESLTAARDAASSGASVMAILQGLRGDESPIQVAPLPVWRRAAGWEALRDQSDAQLAKTGRRLRVFLGNLGSIPEHKARAGFARRLFEAAGFEVISNDGFEDGALLAAAFAESGAEGVVICGSDSAYGALAAPVARALATQRPAFIALAGRPGEREEAWREAGVTDFVFLGCDAREILTRLQAAAVAAIQRGGVVQ